MPTIENPRADRYRDAVAAFLDLLPPGDVLVAGRSRASGPISARTTALRIGVPGRPRIRGTLLRRAAGPECFPAGAFAGCWSAVADPDRLTALARLVRPGGVLAVERPGAGAPAGGHRMPVPGGHVEFVTGTIAAPADDAEPGDTEPADNAERTEGAAPPGEPDCVFCPPLRFRLNRIAGLPGAAAVLGGDDAFFVIPDLAPVAEGHLLLVAAGHRLCAGALTAAEWARAERWLAWVSHLYRAAYGTTGLLVFEHGPARPQEAGACVDHLHLHLLPGAPPLARALDRSGLTGVAAGIATVRALHSAGRSYLWVGDVVYPVDRPRAQVLRWAALAAGAPGGATGPAPAWRWQESFGLPESRRRFLATLGALLPAADRTPLSGLRSATATSEAR